ncbi:protein-glutamine gamma-glutamyltransferase [Gammaproteobacteria bacterium]
MNISFPLLSITILFWGWRIDQVWGAALMAAILEGNRFISWRWQAEDRELYRVADLGALILAGLLIYPYLSDSTAMSQVIHEIRVFPFAFFPLMVAQVYTVRGDFPLTGLFLSLRKKNQENRYAIHLDYPFFGLCLIASTTGGIHSSWYFPGIGLLIGVALWLNRPRRHNPFLWGVVLLLGFGLADQEQKGMLFLHRVVERKFVEWVAPWFRGEVDPYRQNTAIGDIGLLKLSERILFRVDQPQPWTTPLRLREASYNNLVRNSWFSPFSNLRELPIKTPVGSWQLVDNESGASSLTIHQHFSGASAMIHAPQGSVRLEGLSALEMAVNSYGAIKAKEPPSFVSYRIFYDSQRSFDAPPDVADLTVPEREKSAIEEVVTQLVLTGLPASQVFERLKNFFCKNFRYTITLTNAGHAGTPLARFLLDNRAGHCEYFASATVLLLRQVGIPARYVVGYSVHESEGRLRIVRARHAHAWAAAYVNGVWQDVDNTPPDWQALEQDTAPFWSILMDLWSRAWFEIDRYRNSTEPRATWPWLVLAVILSGIMIWRIVRGTGIRRRSRNVESSHRSSKLQPFARIEDHLTHQGWIRGIGEPLGIWLKRIHHTELFPLLALHYRDRYDPHGLSADEEKRLAEEVSTWLNQQRMPPPNS